MLQKIPEWFQTSVSGKQPVPVSKCLQCIHQHHGKHKYGPQMVCRLYDSGPNPLQEKSPEQTPEVHSIDLAIFMCLMTAHAAVFVQKPIEQ